MRLLKKDVPFFWDEATQFSFDTLKHALTTAPLLRPPNYNKYFLLYLAPVESTIGMVFSSGRQFVLRIRDLLPEQRPCRTITQLFSYQKTCIGNSSCCSTVPSLCSVLQDHRHCRRESIPVHVDTTSYRWKNQ
jgi:hypothetical protein